MLLSASEPPWLALLVSTTPLLNLSDFYFSCRDSRADTAIAYAIYFDHRRRTDAEFRRNLKRESRRAARIAQSEVEAEGQARKRRVKEAVESVKKEDLPPPEEREDYFLECIKQGEILSQTGKWCHALQRPFPPSDADGSQEAMRSSRRRGSTKASRSTLSPWISCKYTTRRFPSRSSISWPT